MKLNNFTKLLRRRQKGSLIVWKRELKTLQEMPGPKKLPLVGTSWMYSFFGPYSKDEAPTIAREHMLSKFGPIYKEEFGGSFIVSLHQPAHIEMVLRNQGMYPMRIVNEANVCYRKSKPDIYKNVGLAHTEGEEWYDIRMKVAPTLLKAGSLAGFPEEFSKIADIFIKNIKRSIDGPEGVVVVQHFLYRYGLEAMWKTTFGSRLGALDESPSEIAEQLVPLSNGLFLSFAKLHLSLPWWKLWKTPSYRNFCRAEEEVFKIVNNFTQEIMKRVQTETVEFESTSQTPLIYRYLAMENFDKKDVNMTVIDFIVAGIPTISYFLSFLLHRLGQEKEIQRRIKEELDSHNFKESDLLDEKAILKLTFLQSVLKEGYRLTSIIPGIVRRLPSDVEIDDYVIPALTPIICQTRAASLSEDYFTSPLEFIPDRWYNGDSSKLNKDPKMIQLQAEAHQNRFLVIPFGFGFRMCVGRKLAEREMTVLLAKIFLNFEIESEGNLEIGNFYVLGPKSSVKIKFIQR